ncbi:MAG: winged helix-turn-helix transcriptional regulator [Nanoarchaeota archaeon]
MFSSPSNRKTSELLELESRKKVYTLVRTHPGCHYREIERRSGMPHGTLTYHLHFLVKHGLLSVRKKNNALRYFPHEASADDIQLISLLRQQSLRRIMMRLAFYGSSTHDDLVQFTRLSPSTVSWHTSRLIRDGVIRTSKERARTRYTLLLDRTLVIRAFVTYQESLLDSLVNKVIAMWEL